MIAEGALEGSVILRRGAYLSFLEGIFPLPRADQFWVAYTEGRGGVAKVSWDVG